MFDQRNRLSAEEELAVAPGPALHVVAAPAPSIAIRPEIFAWIYLIYPLVGLFILADIFFFKSRFIWELPDSADDLKLFLVFFGTPHVISGLLSGVDKEYVRAYRRPMIGFCLIFIPLLAIPGATALRSIAIAHFLWTMYHHISQSAGICRVMLGRSNQASFSVWKWSLVAALSLSMPLTKYSVYIAGVWSIPGLFLALVLAANLVCVWQMKLWEKSPLCRTQVALTTGSLAVLPFLYASGYTFFFPVCARFVHDSSAMIFYAVHDQNRVREKPAANRLYGLFAKLPVPVYILCPVLGILISLLSFPLMEHELGLRILYGIAFFHYFMEGWIWKRDSLHRRQIAFA